MQNNLVSLLLILGMAAPVAAKLKVVTTTSDLGWFVREIGGDRIDLNVIVLGTEDPHYIEPKPSYIVKLSRADLLVFNGLDLEVGWLPKLLDGAHNPHIQEGQPGLFSPAAVIDAIEVPDQISRAEGDIHPFGNPHYSLSPAAAPKIAAAIAARLGELDPDGRDIYRARGEDLSKRIADHIDGWKRRLADAHTHDVKVITYHKTFSYFLRYFGIVGADFIEPKPGVPPSARHLAELIRLVQDQHIKLILIENFFEERNGQFVGDRTGIPVVVAPVAVGGASGIDSWFDLIDHLVSAVANASHAKGATSHADH